MSQQVNDITVFAETNYRDQCRLFGIKRDDRRRHMYIIGKTGMGKSELLKQMVYSDIIAGHGICVIDPHGELAEAMLDLIPSHRVNDVVYFNPADLNFPIAFNIMEAVNPEVRHLVASGLVSVFKKIWADSWGPRLEYVLRNAILALLDYPGSTLLGVLRILTDKTYRKKVIEKVKDPVVRSFWVDEYSKYPDRFQAEAIAPIQNKVGQFLSNVLIRNVVGQVKSSIDIRDVMDNQKILILNLSKGRIGEDTSALLGAMMITQIQLAAMSRIDTPEHERKDFYLYVDEFQNFATDSFVNILSEARKYRLNIIIAHQYIEQLDELVQAAVFGNVGTIVCFRIGAIDAEVLVKEFAPYFTEEDLVNLAKWQIYLKLMVDGVATIPFSANTLVPVTKDEGNREKIIKITRERYAKPRDVIEEKISRWASNLEEQAVEEHRMASIQPPRSPRALMNAMKNGANVMPPPRPSSSGREPVTVALRSDQRLSKAGENAASTSLMTHRQDSRDDRTSERVRSTATEAPRDESSASGHIRYEAVCSSCGKATKVSFVPDGKRPVYCKECLRLVRQGLASSEVAQASASEQAKEVHLTELPPRADIRHQQSSLKQEQTNKSLIQSTQVAEKRVVIAPPEAPMASVQPGQTIVLG